MFTVWSSPFRSHLQDVLRTAKQQLLIASPYIKTSEAEWVCEQLARGSSRDCLHLQLLTDIRSGNVLSGSLDMHALAVFQSRLTNCQIINLPRLHAKVYVADEKFALVASANLTPSGLDANLEYGVGITDVDSVRQVRRDMDQYALLGNTLDKRGVSELEAIAMDLKNEYDKLQKSQEKKLRNRFDEKLKAANMQFLRAQIGKRSAHGLFADAMVFLLSSRPLSTKELHPRIRELLPELCSNDTDLVIDGKAFGKKWKHVVRNAQVFLRRAGRICLRSGRWTLVEPKN